MIIIIYVCYCIRCGGRALHFILFFLFAIAKYEVYVRFLNLKLLVLPASPPPWWFCLLVGLVWFMLARVRVAFFFDFSFLRSNRVDSPLPDKLRVIN